MEEHAERLISSGNLVPPDRIHDRRIGAGLMLEQIPEHGQHGHSIRAGEFDAMRARHKLCFVCPAPRGWIL